MIDKTRVIEYSISAKVIPRATTSVNPTVSSHVAQHILSGSFPWGISVETLHITRNGDGHD